MIVLKNVKCLLKLSNLKLPFVKLSAFKPSAFKLSSIVIGLVFFSSSVLAGPVTITGKWAGTAFASNAMDLNADGIPARVFNVQPYAQFVFISVQGVADTTIVAFPGQVDSNCEDPAAFELRKHGTLIFRGWRNDAIYAEIDTSVDCFNPAFADETTLTFTITGGTGFYEGVSGTGSADLVDVILKVSPGGYPQMIDTQGSYTMTFF